MGMDYAARARAFVGTRFQSQGRSIETGLDCVGLVIAVFKANGDEIRRDYRLRGDHRVELETGLGNHFRKIRSSAVRPGDVLLLAVASDQFHLAVRTHSGFVHADAKLGRVVETPGDPKWPVAGVYRKRSRAPIGG